MKLSTTLLLLLATSACGLHSAEPPAAPAAATAPALNTVCPISGKAANPAITTTYEGTTFAFHEEACREKFIADRAASLYQQLGGKAAIDAAVERFYEKVLADDRVKHYFDDVSMVKQKRKQKEFLSVALGAPMKWTGKDMRKAHADLPGLNDTHFNAIAEHLQSTLTELQVKPELIAKVLAIVETTRADVLNKPKAAQ